MHAKMPPTRLSRGTGPETRLIAIKVMRVPGYPLIKGTFWLDDVKILPVAAEADRPYLGYCHRSMAANELFQLPIPPNSVLVFEEV